MSIKDEKELRDHVRIIAMNTINQYKQTRQNEPRNTILLKSWAITTFLLVMGYCIENIRDLSPFLYFILPAVPLVLFWYFIYLIEIYQQKYRKQFKKSGIENILIELPTYSIEKLEEISKQKSLLKIDSKWEKKGKIKCKRFFTEKLWKVFVKFISFKDLLFWAIIFVGESILVLNKYL